MTSQERQKLIAQYKEGYNEVTRSLENFPPDSLTAHPIKGKWSAAEIVHHLADSETTSGIRLRRLLVEDRPLIQGYDQDAYADRLHYNNREMAPALDAFRSARATAALFPAVRPSSETTCWAETRSRDNRAWRNRFWKRSFCSGSQEIRECNRRTSRVRSVIRFMAPPDGEFVMFRCEPGKP